MFITLSIVYTCIQISNTFLPEFLNILLYIYVEANPQCMNVSLMFIFSGKFWFETGLLSKQNSHSFCYFSWKMPHRKCLLSSSEWMQYFLRYSSDWGQTRQAITCSFLHWSDWFSWFIICKWTILWYDDHASCTLTGKPPLLCDTKETEPSVYITEKWNSVTGSLVFVWRKLSI